MIVDNRRSRNGRAGTERSKSREMVVLGVSRFFFLGKLVLDGGAFAWIYPLKGRVLGTHLVEAIPLR